MHRQKFVALPIHFTSFLPQRLLVTSIFHLTDTSTAAISSSQLQIKSGRRDGRPSRCRSSPRITCLCRTVSHQHASVDQVPPSNQSTPLRSTIASSARLSHPKNPIHHTFPSALSPLRDTQSKGSRSHPPAALQYRLSRLSLRSRRQL